MPWSFNRYVATSFALLMTGYAAEGTVPTPYPLWRGLNRRRAKCYLIMQILTIVRPPMADVIFGATLGSIADYP